MKITQIKARQILDSRGNPTVEADVILNNGVFGRAAVPSGASTGTYEALELRDHNPKVYQGKSIIKAVENIEKEIAPALVGIEVENQTKIDQTMIRLDATLNKNRLGANAILAVSLASAWAGANNSKIPLFKYLKQLSGEKSPYLMPVPMMNVINGGKHALGSTDIQEFMIIPASATSFELAVQMGAEIFHSLARVLETNGYQTTVGDEGGFAPAVKNGNKEALDLISQAVIQAGYKLGKEIALGIDVAASELKEGEYYLLKKENKKFTSDQMIEFLESLILAYPIISIEDGLAEDDWEGWENLTSRLGNKTQLVGDDLIVTNPKFLQKAITNKAGNTVLIKPNQIGTLTETIEVVRMAKDNNWGTVMSHRSGETEDVTISHLAVGLSTGQIKTGSLSRTDRIAKYNELLRIDEILGEDAKYTGWKAFRK